MNRGGDSQDEKDEKGSLRRVRLLPRKGLARATFKRKVPAAQLKKGVFLIPSLFTTGNLFCGFFSMIAAIEGHYLQAAILILVAHLMDGLDGAVARVTKTTSQFGVEFDSLADIISFGVAPAMLAYFWALSSLGIWGWLAASLYVICGALRLARFNVQASTVEKTHFIGLPIPAAAEMVVATVLMYKFLGVSSAFHKPIILLLIMYCLAGLMVSNFRYLSLRQLDLKRRHPFWLLISAILFINLSIAEPQIMLFSVFLLYTLSGPLLGLYSMTHRGREKRGDQADSQ